MPGISLLFNLQDNIQSQIPEIEDSLSDLIHFKNYFIRKIINERKLFIASTQYQEYPVSEIKSGSNNYILEGKIYNRENKTVVKKIN